MAINLEQVDSQVAAARGNKDVARAQAILAQLGHYSAGVDGIVGPKTRDAIGKLLENQAAFEDLPSADRSQIQVALQNAGRVLLNAENGEAVKNANTKIDAFQRSCAQREATAAVTPPAPAQAAEPSPTAAAAPEAPLPPSRPADAPKFANVQEERAARIRDAQGTLHDKGYYPQGVTREQAVDGKIGPQTREAMAKAQDAVVKSTANGAECPPELQDVAKAHGTLKELGGESTQAQGPAAAPKPEKEAAPRRRQRPAADKDDDGNKEHAARPKAAPKPGNGAAHGRNGGTDRLADYSYDQNGVPRFNERSGQTPSPEEVNRGPHSKVIASPNGGTQRYVGPNQASVPTISARSGAYEHIPLDVAQKIETGGGFGGTPLRNKEGEPLVGRIVPPALAGKTPQEIIKAMGLKRNEYAFDPTTSGGAGAGASAPGAASGGPSGGCCGGAPGGPGR